MKKDKRFKPLALRFWHKVNKHGPMPKQCAESFGNCWLWQGANNGVSQRCRRKTAYGIVRISDKGKRMLKKATHVAWFLEHGKWPTHLMLHVCDNPLCVRPTHLYDADQSANMYDMFVKQLGGILVECG